MKKIKLIYNPFSGDKGFHTHLDAIISNLQGDNPTDGYEVHLYRVKNFGDVDFAIKNMVGQNYDAVAIAGGDGSINLAINALKKYDLQIPLGIFPSGTANDFAGYLALPSDYAEIAKLILQGNTKEVDIGCANDKYFINVACVGLFASISQGVDTELKNLIGRAAYYITALEAMPNISPMNLKITTSDQVIEAKAYLALILNSTGAGGFKNIAPNSHLDDGLLDLVVFKEGHELLSIPKLFINTLRGDLVSDKNIIYLQDSYFKVESLDDNTIYHDTDIDGEKGPNLPLEVAVMPKAIRVFCS